MYKMQKYIIHPSLYLVHDPELYVNVGTLNLPESVDEKLFRYVTDAVRILESQVESVILCQRFEKLIRRRIVKVSALSVNIYSDVFIQLARVRHSAIVCIALRDHRRYGSSFVLRIVPFQLFSLGHQRIIVVVRPPPVRHDDITVTSIRRSPVDGVFTYFVECLVACRLLDVQNPYLQRTRHI